MAVEDVKKMIEEKERLLCKGMVEGLKLAVDIIESTEGKPLKDVLSAMKNVIKKNEKLY